MKKLATLLLAAGMVFGACTGASAIDFKAKGQWFMFFEYGQNGDFSQNSGTHTGFKSGEDEFEARQRIRLGLEAVASENLSGTVMFEIDNDWGKSGSVANKNQGGSLGSDGVNVKVKHAYLDWMVPQTDLKVRMGIQAISLPSFTTGSQVFSDDVAGISASYQFNDNVGLTAFWARPYNDNYTDTSSRASQSGYMDNVDLFALTLPLTFDGVKVTPWAMLGFIGNNSYGNYTGQSGKLFNAGMFPLGGARRQHGNASSKKINTYGTAWWAGATAEVTVLDPLRMALDLNYGSVDWSDSRLNRYGWLVSGLVEYKMDWGTPGIVGWYASGDDGDPSNGSERMPTPSVDGNDNDFSMFAFNGAPSRVRQSAISGSNMSGTWGVGLRLKDMSFVEDLKHTFRVNYIGGTNSPRMVKRHMSTAEQRVWGYENFADQFATGLGNDNLYMTTSDSAVEFNLVNEYKMYENFKIYTMASYLATSIDNNRGYKYDGITRKDIKDPWNISVSFMYNF